MDVDHCSKTVRAVDGCQPNCPIIRSADEWVHALKEYGEEPPVTPTGAPNPRFPGPAAGMQDTTGTLTLPRPLLDTAGTRGVVTLVYEKTAHVPHRMSSLWYRTTTLTDRFNEASRRAVDSGRSPRIPSLASWRVMAAGIGERSPVPLYLSGAD